MTSTATPQSEPLTHGRVLVVVRRVSRELLPDARVTGEHRVVTP